MRPRSSGGRRCRKHIELIQEILSQSRRFTSLGQFRVGGPKAEALCLSPGLSPIPLVIAPIARCVVCMASKGVSSTPSTKTVREGVDWNDPVFPASLVAGTICMHSALIVTRLHLKEWVGEGDLLDENRSSKNDVITQPAPTIVSM